nr:TetR/AcrR family transcriptional regulator [Rhodococcus sp. JVH1]EJI93328.1 transcriptional regulator, TetR family [Rhodococcus sp. JVH1]
MSAIIHCMQEKGGLRERKRLATRQLIETTAVELVGARGYDAVTVDMICAASNVSSRTFFNYFPSKDAAVIGDVLVAPDDDTVNRLLDEYPADPLRAVIHIFETAVHGLGDDFDLLSRRRQIIKGNPELLQRHLRGLHELEESLTRLVAQRLLANPEQRHLAGRVDAEEEASATVMTAGAAMRYVFRRWQNSDKNQTRAELLTPALELMAEIIRPANPQK